jgi:hypothetical protein
MGTEVARGVLVVARVVTVAGRVVGLTGVVGLARVVEAGRAVVVVRDGPRVIVRKPVMVTSMGALVMVSSTPLSSGSTMVL